MATQSKLAVILHADVVGSTALVQLNERIAHDRIQDAFRRLSETIASHGGTTHELRGDALVAEFPRASDAVSAATPWNMRQACHVQDIEGTYSGRRTSWRVWSRRWARRVYWNSQAEGRY